MVLLKKASEECFEKWKGPEDKYVKSQRSTLRGSNVTLPLLRYFFNVNIK